MTVATTGNKFSYAGNGSTTPFSFPRLFLEGDDLRVIITVDSTGVETLQTIVTHYTVTGAGNPSGGTVTMVTAPATGETLTIRRLTDDEQNTDYPSSPTYETALDKLTLRNQDLQEEIDRSPKLKESTSTGALVFPEPVADKVIGWNSGGTALENQDAAVGGGGLDNVVEDLSPQLGANLDTQSFTVDGRDVGTDGTKLDTIETSATADQSDAEIETAYNAQVGIVSQVDAEAGTSTTAERWTPQRVGQAITALAGSGSLSNVVEDLTPQLGGELDTNEFDVVFGGAAGNLIKRDRTTDLMGISGGNGAAIGGNAQFFGSTHATLASHIQFRTGGTIRGEWDQTNSQWEFNANTVITGTLTGITQLDVDNLRVDGNAIISTNTDGDIEITPNGAGSVVLDGLNWPQADGTNGQVVQTDGAGQLSFFTLAGGGNVSNTGTPLDDQIAVFTNATTVEGTTGLTYTGVALGVTGNITPTGTVDGRDVATDGTKLDGVEAGADVTDETNVVAALDGATLTDMGVPAATDKVLIQDTSDADNLKYADFSDFAGAGLSNVVEDTTPQLGGNLDTQSFTVDGRDVGTDGTKLDGIEALADVTDTTNVTAAGALMDSEVDADIKTLVLPASTTISAFGATLIDDAAASNARTTLGLGALATLATVGTTEIDTNAVNFARMQDIVTDRLIGRDTAGTGDPEEISLNATLEFTGSQVLQRAALTGDVTASAGSNATTVISASTTAAGKAELATTAEIDAATDTGRVLGVDEFAGSRFATKEVSILVFDDSEDVATGNGANDVFWRVPSTLGGMNLVAVAASHQTAGTGTGVQTTDVQIHNVTQAADMLSTVLTVDEDETDSSTAATAAVIDAANDDVATGDQIRIDVDAITGTTAPKGLLVELQFRMP